MLFGIWTTRVTYGGFWCCSNILVTFMEQRCPRDEGVVNQKVDRQQEDGSRKLKRDPVPQL